MKGSPQSKQNLAVKSSDEENCRNDHGNDKSSHNTPPAFRQVVLPLVIMPQPEQRTTGVIAVVNEVIYRCEKRIYSVTLLYESPLYRKYKKNRHTEFTGIPIVFSLENQQCV